MTPRKTRTKIVVDATIWVDIFWLLGYMEQIAGEDALGESALKVRDRIMKASINTITEKNA